MTWPTSPAAVSGGNISASGWNAVRADLASINGYAEKSADESRTSSTVLSNDLHLAWSIGSTGTYIFDLCLWGLSAANAAGDLAVGFSFPTGTAMAGGVGPDASLASGNAVIGQFGVNTALVSGSAFNAYGLSTGTTQTLIRVRLAATATGTFRLMWAQSASSASASTLKAGSHMLVRQVA